MNLIKKIIGYLNICIVLFFSYLGYISIDNYFYYNNYNNKFTEDQARNLFPDSYQTILDTQETRFEQASQFPSETLIWCLVCIPLFSFIAKKLLSKKTIK